MPVPLIKSTITQADARDDGGKWVFRSFWIKLNAVVISIDHSASSQDCPSISWNSLFNKRYRK